MNSKGVDELMKHSNSPMLMGEQTSNGIGGEKFCMQRFVKSKGSKASIVRATYSGHNKLSVSVVVPCRHAGLLAEGHLSIGIFFVIVWYEVSSTRFLALTMFYV
jgi:hypothetical protein